METIDMCNTTRQTVTTSLKVLMFPWLAYGHISPFLQLAKKLTSRGVHVYLCSTPINLSFISKEIRDKYSNSIEMVEIHLPNSPELPPEYHTSNGLPRRLQVTLRKALKMSEPGLENILKSLKPDLLIYDAVLPLFSINPPNNIPSLFFDIMSAICLSYTTHMFLKLDTKYPFLTGCLRDYELAKYLNELGNDISPEDIPLHHPILVNTSREIEGKYLDHAASIYLQGKIKPIGPLVQYPAAASEGSGKQQQDTDELIKWLGRKKKHSTVFACFGSEYFLTIEEIKEIAHGLELSGDVNFIWAIRFPKGEENVVQLDEILPEGFLEKVKDRGRIVRGWAPQALILSHSNTGAFISHCGWSSILEGIEFGVPILAMPMNYEQPLNARLMVENGVADEIMRDESGRLNREEIARVIKNVVIGNGGKSMRQKMKDLKKNMKSSQEEDLDEVIKTLIQLSEKKSDSDAMATTRAKLG